MLPVLPSDLALFVYGILAYFVHLEGGARRALRVMYVLLLPI